MNKKKKWYSFRWRFLIVLIAIIVLLGCCSDQLIFHPPKASYKDTSEVMKIPTAKGQKVSAIYLRNPSAKYTILLSHGNAEDIGQLGNMLDRFFKHGYSVMAYDYRGFGTSDGWARERNTYEDITAVYRHLVEVEGVEADKIIIYGRSVGGGPSVYLASRERAGGLVIQSGFVSAFRVVMKWWFLPIDKFNNKARIVKVTCPVMIIHGTKDKLIDIWHGKQLYETANEPKMSYWVEGAGHNDVIWVAGSQFWKELDKFIELVESRRELHYE